MSAKCLFNSNVKQAVASLIALSLLTISTTATAKSTYTALWKNLYPNSDSADNAGCALCHSSYYGTGGYLNFYGGHMASSSAGDGSGDDDVIDRILDIEDLDSDNDPGDFSNIEEINADAQPAWSASAPSGVSGALDPNVPPTADAGGPYTGVEGQSIAFDGSASDDTDGTIVRYDWDFGDGTQVNDAGPTPSHTYTAANSYTVSLTVRDDDGDSDSATAGVTVSVAPNVPPTADAGGPYAGTEWAALAFDGSGSDDTDGTIVRYDWDFGDGSQSDNAGPTPSHTYTTPDTYTVTLTVTDDDGDTDSDTASVTISDAPNFSPTADAGGPYSGYEGNALTFDGSASDDIDGSLVRYDWDFGDGTQVDDAGPGPSHTYAAMGDYTVTLTVTDNESATDTATAPVSIGEQPVQGKRHFIQLFLPALL